MIDMSRARERMVADQIAARGVRDHHVLEAMKTVPREAFVDPAYAEFACDDSPLPIGQGQTISQPYIVAVMIEAAEIHPGDRVLEVGAGCGYAAAVMSRIAANVYAIERHKYLGDAAREHLAHIGYDNVEVMVADGTMGWPDAAPFDAIIVSAGGPRAPEALKKQLKIGGRLVIPVGEDVHSQRLLRIVRRGEAEFDEHDLGAVRFVPLVGEQGWAEQDGETRQATTSVPPPPLSLPQMIAKAAEPLPGFDDPAFGRLFDRYADRKVVLLGEASHGTSEFYKARAAVTRHFVEAHGFDVIAVEADWPDAATIDRYVRHRAGSSPTEPPFMRFPTWMWRNFEAHALIEWLRARNERIEDLDRRAGFYGLDIYNMNDAISAVLEYLDRVDPEAARVARERYGCLTPWQKEPSTYGRAVLSAGYEKCEKAAVKQCQDLLQQRIDYAAKDGEAFLDAAQNARVVMSAERYYRIMYYGGAESWNLRDQHMFDTLRHVLDARGPEAKALVWAHNSHVGDARHTEMGAARAELNIGQLCRQHFGDRAALIGFGTHDGEVAAADDWGGDMEIMSVRPSRDDSYERLCHDSGIPRFLLDFNVDKDLRRKLEEPRLERFIGVIYRPETELMSHYSQASLPRQFDSYVWFDRTSAVTPLGPEHARPGAPETYPFGL